MPIHHPAATYKRADDAEPKHSGTTRPTPTKRIRIILVFVVLSALYTLTHVLELPHRLREGISRMTSLPSGYRKSIVYHTDWANYARNFQVTNLATFMGGITDVVVAFFNLQDSGGGNYVIVSGDTNDQQPPITPPWADFQNPFIGNGVNPQNTQSSPPQDLGIFGQFAKLSTLLNGSFHLTLAIGGWTWSQNFSLAVSTASSRQSLAQSIVTLFQSWSAFKGVSIDWEYLSSNGVNYGNTGNVVSTADGANFVSFVQVLRGLFQQNGMGDYTIAMCCTPAPEKIQFDVSSLVPYLDEWHIMTYDFASGAWSNISAHQSNLYPSPYGPYSASGAVEAYISKGVPAEKLYIGIPFYSRGFAGTNGLGQSATGPSPDTSWDAGVVDYKALPITGATEQWDPVAQAGYSYDPVRKVLNTYDVPQAVKAKCQYVIQKGLGGVIIWESSADAPYGTARSLLQTIHDNLLIFNPGGAPSPSNPAPGSSTSNFPSQTNPGTNINQQPINPVTSPSILGQSGSILPWNPSTYYSVGSLVTYNGITYKCIQAHQAQLAWNPAIVPALWQPIS